MTPAPERPDLMADRQALWEKFTGGERLAYGLGYRDAERAAAPAPDAGLRAAAQRLADLAQSGDWTHDSEQEAWAALRAALAAAPVTDAGLDVERLVHGHRLPEADHPPVTWHYKDGCTVEVHEDGSHTFTPFYDAAPVTDAGLDVERLARAITATVNRHDITIQISQQTASGPMRLFLADIEFAKALAAEYARQAEKETA